MSVPAWLPAMADVDPWKANTYDLLYEIFLKDFVASKPRYQGFEVWCFPELEDRKIKIFWHLTSREDKATHERFPDLRRAERLPWARPLIEHPEDSEVLAWDYEEGNKDIHSYVWLKNHDYVVVLKKYKDGRRRIITAYWIDYEHKRKDLLRKYQQKVA
jgi:hypothetical protein